jgi:hypothetical protein
MQSIRALFGSFLIALGCTRAMQMPTAAAPTPQPRGITIVDSSRPRLVIDDLHPSEVPAAVDATFRLMPDRRVLTAVADVYELSTGRKESKVEIDFRENAWLIRYAGQDVGTLPELATFHEDLDFLTQWAARLRSQRATASPLSPDVIAAIDRNLSAFSPPNLFAASNLIARSTKGKSFDGPAAARATHTTVLLTSQIFDRFELGDPLRARALALLAVARQIDAQCCAEDEALIARLLEYESEAKSLASSLPQSTYAAQFIAGASPDKVAGPASDWLQKSAALRRASLSAPQTIFRGNLDVQFAPLLNEIDSFGDQIDIARAEESLILREVESNQFNAGTLTFNGDSEWSTVYPHLNFDEKTPLTRFDRALPRRIRTLENSVLDSDSVRSYYESNFYAALFKEFNFHHYMRYDRNGETAFVAELGKPETDLAKQIVSWMHALNVVSYDAARGARGPREDLKSARLAGGVRRTDLIQDYAGTVGWNQIPLRRAAVELYRELDCRPSEMYQAGRLSLWTVADPYRRDRYTSTAIDRFPSFVPEGEVAYFRLLTGDRAALRALVENGPSVNDRIYALSYLADLGDGDSEFVHRKFEELAGNTVDTSGLVSYASYLNKRGEAVVKERFMRQWLQKFRDRGTPIGVAWVAASLANALERQGKYREAWEAIAPYVEVGSESVMVRAASILQHLGRVDEANKLDAQAVERYPGAGARADFAAILWREGRLKEAAELFNPRKADYALPGALSSLPHQFFETYKDAKPDQAMDALSELIGAGLNYSLLDAIPKEMLKEHRPALAFALVERLTAEASRTPGAYRPESMTPLLTGYRALKELKGADAAIVWLQARIPATAKMQANIVFYQDGEFDLVQRFAATVSDDAKITGAAALEAASLLRMRVPMTDVRWEKLRERIRTLPDRPTEVPMAQYLAGSIDEPTFLAAAKTRETHTDAEYFIGEKRLAENKPEAALPMMIAASFGAQDSPPAAWGLGQLYRWADEHASWQEIAANASSAGASTSLAEGARRR